MSLNNPGSWWRGRPAPPFDDDQIIEQARQRLADEQIAAMNELIIDLSTDPQHSYAEHRKAYEETGSLLELQWMLDCVQP